MALTKSIPPRLSINHEQHVWTNPWIFQLTISSQRNTKISLSSNRIALLTNRESQNQFQHTQRTQPNRLRLQQIEKRRLNRNITQRKTHLKEIKPFLSPRTHRKQRKRTPSLPKTQNHQAQTIHELWNRHPHHTTKKCIQHTPRTHRLIRHHHPQTHTPVQKSRNDQHRLWPRKQRHPRNWGLLGQDNLQKKWTAKFSYSRHRIQSRTVVESPFFCGPFQRRRLSLHSQLIHFQNKNMKHDFVYKSSQKT